jgi:hypothetical protein
MNATPSRFRRLAGTLTRHAARVLPSAPSSWAQAMRHELAYIADDKAALRWAFGCMLASYKARFMQRTRLSPRTAWRQIATSAALMLLIGLALQEHAASQTEPPPPAFNEQTCDLPDASPELRLRPRCGPCDAKFGNKNGTKIDTKIAADFINHPTHDVDASCADRAAPIPVLPKRQ